MTNLKELEELLGMVQKEKNMSTEADAPDYSKMMSVEPEPQELPVEPMMTPMEQPQPEVIPQAVQQSQPMKESQVDEVEQMQSIVQADNAPKGDINPLDQMTYAEMMKLGGPAKAEEFLRKSQGQDSSLNIDKSPQTELDRKESLLKDSDNLKEKKSSPDDELKKARWLDALSSIGNSVARYGRNEVAQSPQTQFTKELLAQQQAQASAKKSELKEKEMSDYRQERLDLQRDNNERREKSQSLRERKEDRMIDQFSWRRKEKDELSDKQGEQMAGYDNALSKLKAAQQIKKDKDIDTGLLSAGTSWAKGLAGIEDPDNRTLKMNLGSALADTVKTMSGAAASDKEREFLNQVSLPEFKMNDKQFDAAMKTALDLLENAKSARLDWFEKQGKDIGHIKRESKPQIVNASERKPGDQWSDDAYSYRMTSEGKIQRRKK